MVGYITVIFPHKTHKPTQIMGMALSHKKAGDTCFTATLIQLCDCKNTFNDLQGT